MEPQDEPQELFQSSSSVEPVQPQQLPQEPEQQLTDVKCMICWEDVLPNEPAEKCATCTNGYHRNCIIHWLNTCLEKKRETNCPCCRTNMEWLVMQFLSPPLCALCGQYIGPHSRQFTCLACDRVFHENEILELVVTVISSNNLEQSLKCPGCETDISSVLNLLEVSADSDNHGIQPAELNHIINIFTSFEEQLDFVLEYGFESDPEDEAE